MGPLAGAACLFEGVKSGGRVWMSLRVTARLVIRIEKLKKAQPARKMDSCLRPRGLVREDRKLSSVELSACVVAPGEGWVWCFD